jgi:iron complex outermembrane receptor protein
MPLHTPRADLLVAGAAVALLAPLARLHAQAGDVTGRVTQAGSDEPIAGATVAVTGQRRGAITRGDGTYRITLPAGQYELAARLIGYTSVKANVTVAAGGTVTQNFQLTRAASVLSAVAVTGSRRATERSVTEAPVPIDVVTSAEIKQTGRTETSQILQMLVPSVNFPRTSIAGGVDMQRPFTLRGLGPDQALVLINGKRRHAGAVVAVNNSIGRGSTGVDLNAIPAASIERIEVLRDGAAAQYGSDAIGGVINIILKEDAPGSISATVGQVNSSLNAPPLGALRYNDGGVVQLDANKGWDFGGGRGFLNLTAEARDRGATSRNLPDQRPQYWTAATDDSVRRGLPVTIGGVRVPEAAVDFSRNNFWYGDAAIRDGGGFWNAGYKPGRGIEVYSFGGATYRVGRSFGFSRRPAEPVVVRSLHPQGFLPSIVGTSQDVSGAVGAKGRAAGWAWDVSGTVGQNRFAFDVNNSNNPTLGNASPRDFYAGTLRSTQMTYNADASRQFAVGLAAPVNVGVGAEARFDRYAIARGDTASWIDGGQAVLDGPQRGARVPGGSQLFYGFKPSDVVNATRESQAAVRRRRGDAGEPPAARRRGTLRKLQRLRPGHHRQAHGALRAGEGVRAPRGREHRLPRAVARADVLLVHGEQRARRRRRADAQRGRHAPGHEPGRARARRHGPPAGEEPELRRGDHAHAERAAQPSPPTGSGSTSPTASCCRRRSSARSCAPSSSPSGCRATSARASSPTPSTRARAASTSSPATRATSATRPRSARRRASTGAARGSRASRPPRRSCRRSTSRSSAASSARASRRRSPGRTSA